MEKWLLVILIIFSTNSLFASPVEKMNNAFTALVDLIPYMSSPTEFTEKKNEAIIQQNLDKLQSTFKLVKHESLLKQDIFAPSYKLINEYLVGSSQSFKKGKKTYTQWRLREITTLCIDCHTRIPASHSPSFNSSHFTIETTMLVKKYDIGIAQLIVRRYSDARKNFIQNIDNQIKSKDETDILNSFKQVLLIDLKVNHDSQQAKSFLLSYINNKNLSSLSKTILKEWLSGLSDQFIKRISITGIKDQTDLNNFIKTIMQPLENEATYNNSHDLKLLLASGLLSNYLFENNSSPKSTEVNYWIGWIEKRLKRENFFSSGDLFLKQCIRRYPKDPFAKKCLKEYEESVEFDFSGSSGAHIPEEIILEIEELKKLI